MFFVKFNYFPRKLIQLESSKAKLKRSVTIGLCSPLISRSNLLIKLKLALKKPVIRRKHYPPFEDSSIFK